MTMIDPRLEPIIQDRLQVEKQIEMLLQEFADRHGYYIQNVRALPALPINHPRRGKEMSVNIICHPDEYQRQSPA